MRKDDWDENDSKYFRTLMAIVCFLLAMTVVTYQCSNVTDQHARASYETKK